MLQDKVREAAQRADQFTHLAHWFNPVPDDPSTRNKNLFDAQSLNVAGNVVSYTTSFIAGALEMIVLLYFLLTLGMMRTAFCRSASPAASRK